MVMEYAHKKSLESGCHDSVCVLVLSCLQWLMLSETLSTTLLVCALTAMQLV